jgi:hypothetical protein
MHLRSWKAIPTIMAIQPINDFHPFHTFLHEELDNGPLIDFHETSHFFGIAQVISAGLVGYWP